MSLPVTRTQAKRAAEWMRANFGDEIRAAAPSPFNENHLYAMACQETACYWLDWIDRVNPETVLARCVFDASGDLRSSPRVAFPRHTGAFQARYGDDFTELLISEANASRKLRGLQPWRIIYKGYGIFQYDLQFVLEDEAFFRERKWHSMAECLSRVRMELERAWRREMTIPGAIMRYNGSGARARQYSANVMQFVEWIK